MTAIVDQQGVAIEISWVAVGVVLLAAVALWLVARRTAIRGFGEMEISEAELGIGQQKLKIRPSREDIQIAHKLWVEVSTRKIGLPLDFDHDVIVEVYDSWYAFFGVTRELIKDIPAHKIRHSESTKRLVSISVAMLNDGVRPHLTTWQARFRRWYDRALLRNDGAELEPQELQRQFPKFQELVADLTSVNQRLIVYRDMLGTVAHGD